jgi:hypothetical protein
LGFCHRIPRDWRFDIVAVPLKHHQDIPKVIADDTIYFFLIPAWA